MLLSTASQPADGPAGWDEQGGRESCAMEEGDGSTALHLPQNAVRQHRGQEDTLSTSVPAPDANASQIN